MDVPWKVIFAFVGVFIAGAIFGGVFTIGASARRGPNGVRSPQVPERPAPAETPSAKTPTAAVTPPPAVRPNPITVQLMNQFTRRLSPTTEQRDEFRKILGRAGEDLQRLRQENLADVNRVTERMYADVSNVLSADQRSELEKMRRQYEERLQADKQKREQAAAAERANKASGSATPPRPTPTPARVP
jgi:hypothetical protein